MPIWTDCLDLSGVGPICTHIPFSFELCIEGLFFLWRLKNVAIRVAVLVS